MSSIGLGKLTDAVRPGRIGGSFSPPPPHTLDPSPSADDIRLTGELASAGRVLDIDFLDHVVLGSFGRSASMRALGYLG
jgi:hypothetical protein